MVYMSKLSEKLVEFRDLQAKREGIENYKVLQYPTIEEICKTMPKTLSELGKVKGIGPAKLKKYGNAILAMVAASGHDNNGDDVVIPANEPESRTGDMRGPGSRINSGMTEEAEKQVISVGEYLDYLNVVFQKTADVKIQGEISAPKEYPSGVYFTLKDKRDESALSCFLPLYTYRGLGLPLDEGMEVRVEGMPRMVRRNGRFQFTVENLELAGEGALKKTYELLKKKLEAEGVFARKRQLPECISRIGIITSRSGAVIHDFRNNVDSRGLQLFLKDVRVEGGSAPGQIISAIKYFNRADLELDCIVVMRGGGSLEDLQAFNTETVVRAVFASNIPVIAAIGHDTDVPLVCLAADTYTSTPTAAAVRINHSWSRVVEAVPDLTHQLIYNYEAWLDETLRRLYRSSDSLMAKLGNIFEKAKYITLKIESKVGEYITWVDRQNGFLNQIFDRITVAVERQITSHRNTMQSAEVLLESNNPERNLKLGYSILRTKDGKIIKKVEQVRASDSIYARLGDGSFEAYITNIQENEHD